MACNRVIVNSVELNSHYAKMFKENNIGVAVDIGDYDGLAQVILDLYKSPETIATMAKNANEFGKKYFSSTQGTRKYMNIFDELGSKKK